MSARRELALDWLPPAIFRWIRSRRRAENRYSGDFATWEQARAECSGYDAAEILAKVLDATLKVKRGEAAFERDSVLFDQVEYAWPVLSGLMWVAARNRGKLSVLDFGGALGSTYFQNRRFLQALPEVRWNVVEQAHYVEAGQANIQDTQLRFYRTIEECLSEVRPNVVLLSGVLQYLQSPMDIIDGVSGIGADSLIVDRTPFSNLDRDRILIQRVPSTIYAASYPMWAFSMQKFMGLLETNWRLIASNQSPEGLVQSTSGFAFSFQGMLLEPRR